MRLKNVASQSIVIPHVTYTFGDDKHQYIQVSYSFDAGEVTEELDPKDPIVQSLLLGGLVEIKIPTQWERILKPQF